MTALIQLRGITKVFGSGVNAFQALKGVDLDIEEGDFIAVMGASGGGKSTTMNILGCLDTPTSGTYLFMGHHVETLSNDQRALLRRRYLGFVFQGFNLLSRTTALENVELPLLYRGEDRKTRHEMAMAALDLVGLGPWAKHSPAELSGGQQQRVAVARALVVEPQVLLLDEPLSNLDARLRRRVRTDIRELQQRLGFTAVYVTHDQDEALAVSDRIIVMKDGGIAQQGAPRELYDAPVSAFIADFMGEANVMTCDVIETDGDSATIAIEGLLHRISGRSVTRGPAQLAVRPNAIMLTPRTSNGSFNGLITHSAYLGDHVEYEVKTDRGSLFVIDATVDSALPPDTDVTIAFKDRGVAVIGG